MQKHRLPPAIAAIKAEAKKRNWSNYRFAQETGLTEPTIQRVLDGEVDPRFFTVELMAAAVGLRIGAS